MHCNIDSKGKAARLIIGFLLLIVGAAILVGFRLNPIAWWLGLAIIACGVFCIIEGWAGWCVVRALGLKTRI